MGRVYKFKQMCAPPKITPKQQLLGSLQERWSNYQKHQVTVKCKRRHGATSCLVCWTKRFPLEYESADGESMCMCVGVCVSVDMTDITNWCKDVEMRGKVVSGHWSKLKWKWMCMRSKQERQEQVREERQVEEIQEMLATAAKHSEEMKNVHTSSLALSFSFFKTPCLSPIAIENLHAQEQFRGQDHRQCFH